MEIQDMPKLIVGLDIGTTTTEVAFCYIDKSGHSGIKLFNSWPQSPSRDSRCPSIVAVGPRGTQAISWGFGVAPDQDAHVWFELTLDRQWERYGFYDSTLRALLGSKFLNSANQPSSEEIMTIFLGQLREHVHNVLRHEFKEHFFNISIEYHFTIPAYWPSETQVAMQNSIQNAGFATAQLHSFELKSEPKVAAQYLMLNENIINPELSIGDRVLLCDRGGGTVDIVSYLLKEISPNFQTKILSSPQGGKCGGAAIDCALYDHLRGLSQKYHWFFPFGTSPEMRVLLESFQSLKSTFSGSQNEGYSLPMDVFPAQARHMVPKIHLDADMIRRLYDPILRKIFGLIQSQMTRAKKKLSQQGINVSFDFLDSRTFSWSKELSRQELENSVSYHQEHLFLQSVGEIMASPFFHCLLSQEINHWPISLRHFISSAGYSRRDTIYNLPYEIPHLVQIPHISSDALIKTVRIYECSSDTLPESVQDQTPGIDVVNDIQCDFRLVNISNSQFSTHNGYTHYSLMVSIQVSLNQANRLLEFIASYNGAEIGRTGIALSVD
ncbi:hypothetical protein N7528_005579 [Penicillium herquei]|nr:hypothetical protein N7528_005579 [Penicillium herquei]